MNSKVWPIVAVFGISATLVVVPYAMKSPEAAACATAIAAMLPGILSMLKDAMRSDTKDAP